MNKFFTLLLLSLFALMIKAQAQAPAAGEEPFGKVSQEDLELKACDFEKDANAEVLFSIGKLDYNDDLKTIIVEMHRRIKVFNDNGKDKGNIRIEFWGGNHAEFINGIEAETINLVNGKPEVTKLDKKQIFTNIIDKESSEITFAMPNVKAGSIIDYKYKYNSTLNAYIHRWYFQEDIPVRYCEYSTIIPDIFYFRPNLRVYQPLVKQTTSLDSRVLKVISHTFTIGDNSASGSQESESYPYNVNIDVKALANIPSLHMDAYTSSFENNVQDLDMNLVNIKPIGGFNKSYSDTWNKVAGLLIDDDDFGSQMNKSLKDEDAIISKASALSSQDEKIAYVFNEVKKAMKWNGIDRWYTSDGTSKAWDNKTGNSAEINLILYHLLKKAGVDVYPMVVSTSKHGKVNPFNTSLYEFNRAVAYVPVDSTKNYVLDATGKYNIYNEPPAELLNSMGLSVNKAKKTFDTLTIKRNLPLREVILINAEIKPGGKLEGTAQINSSSYDRISAVKRYKTDGETKYIDYLRDGDNNLKIASVKFENMEVDTLPLTQNIAFSLEPASSDDNYIYLNANLFSSTKTNPFLSESRMTDIYVGYKKNYSINTVYKLPAGYKADALPKSVSMVMADKSISFKRIVAEQDGSVLVHYVLDFRKGSFNVDEYPAIHDFYKKMYELLNEQIVLKKG